MTAKILDQGGKMGTHRSSSLAERLREGFRPFRAAFCLLLHPMSEVRAAQSDYNHVGDSILKGEIEWKH